MMQECLICLDKMNKADIAYPILCNCGYNFCINCIEHMIETSKQPMEMASDGNVAVKIQLQCPQVRDITLIVIHNIAQIIVKHAHLHLLMSCCCLPSYKFSHILKNSVVLT